MRSPSYGGGPRPGCLLTAPAPRSGPPTGRRRCAGDHPGHCSAQGNAVRNDGGAMETTQSIVDIHDTAGPTDTTAEFDQLQAAMATMFERVQARFELEPDPSVEEFHTYGVEDGPTGSINAYAARRWTGDPLLDRQPRSRVHQPAPHLLDGPQTLVPHFGMAWGTLPDYWYFQDYVPRIDPLVNSDYLHRYYEPQTSSSWAEPEPGLSPFVSQTLYIRQSVSHTALLLRVRADAGERVPQIDLAEPGDRLARLPRRGPPRADCRPGRPGRTRPVRAPAHRRPRPRQRHGRAILRRGHDRTPRPRPVGRRTRSPRPT